MPIAQQLGILLWTLLWEFRTLKLNLTMTAWPLAANIFHSSLKWPKQQIKKHRMAILEGQTANLHC